jgi:hypothetical protein
MPNKLKLDEFINKSNDIHNFKYDYSKVIYKSTHEKIEIICPIHGPFYQTPYHHTIRKQGCRNCVILYSDIKGFINKSNEIHNNAYDYSESNYIKANIPVIIICHKHGIFKQTPSNHVHLKQGCPKCSKKCDTQDEFIEKCNIKHNYKYDYSLIEYENRKRKVKIICPIHGTFEQFPYAHLNKGQGCPICNDSKGEKEIAKILDNLNISYERQKTFKDCKNIYTIPFDFYISKFNVCVEYDGIQHFQPVSYWGGVNRYENQIISDNIKNQYCKDNNIKLIRIRYDENIEQKLSFLK